jgi:predicted nuclease of predicted toxin-antitoxin system
MDAHVPWPLTKGLRQRGVDVVTAQEDGTDSIDDTELLQRATALDRVVFTFDSDFLRASAMLQARGIPFAGIVMLRGRGVDLGQCIDDLELICKAYDAHDIENLVEFLPFS